MITSGTGESVKVESDNWMSAMGKAMAFFDVGLDGVVQWQVRSLAGGVIDIEDEEAGQRYAVRPVASQIVRVVASGPSMAEREQAERDEFVDPETTNTEVVPPTLTMPRKSGLAPPSMLPAPSPFAEQPEEDEEDEGDEAPWGDALAERLFDLSMDLAGAPSAEACRMALDIVLELVPCQASSVAKGTLNDVALTFVAATGPVGDRLIGEQVAFGQGLVGTCFDTGMSIVVNEVKEDTRHFSRVDEATGFETHALLCVPIKNEFGTFGVFQLLNPERPFSDRDVEIVETIAQTLAGALALS